MWKNQAGIVGNSRKNFRPLSLPTSYSHEKSFHITTGPESNFEMMDSSKSLFAKSCLLDGIAKQLCEDFSNFFFRQICEEALKRSGAFNDRFFTIFG